MTDNKEKHSIDDLFRQAFEELPPQPGASGWDKPSDRVWQHLERNLDTPAKGNNLFGKIVGGVATLAIVAGAWYYWSQPAPASVPAKTNVEVTPVQSPAVAETPTTPTSGQTNNRLQPVAPKVPTTVVQPRVPEQAEPLPAVPAPASPATALPLPGGDKSRTLPGAVNTPQLLRIEDTQNGKSRALPGTPDVDAPNTTERLNNAWKKPLKPLPQRWPKQ